MSDETYNGYANYETWAVALWINNEQSWQESVHEAIRGAVEDPTVDLPALDAYDAGAIVRESVEQNVAWSLTGDPDGDYPASLTTDLVNASLSSVNWTELGRLFLESAAETADA